MLFFGFTPSTMMSINSERTSDTKPECSDAWCSLRVQLISESDFMTIQEESSADPLELSASFSTMAKKHACAFVLGWFAGTSGLNPFVLLGL